MPTNGSPDRPHPSSPEAPKTSSSPLGPVDRWEQLSRLFDETDQDVGVRLQWDGPEEPILKAGDKVGHVTLTGEDGNETQITIHPKVPGSVSGMLRAVLRIGREETLAFEQRPSGREERPSAWLAALFAERLERFLSQIRSRGVEQTEELNGRVRGRPLVSRYLKENYWTKPQRMPCRYVEWTEDNLPNRILRHAVAVARRAVSPYGADAQTTLGQLRRCNAQLASVDHVRIQPGDFRRADPMLKGPFRAYEPVVKLAELLITAADPFDRMGEHEDRLPAVQAFDRGESEDGRLRWDLVDMPDLFEEYVRVVTGGTRARDTYSIPLEGTLPGPLQELRGKRLELDREPIQVGGSLVLDAKYMSVGRSSRGPTPHRDESGRIHLREYAAFAPLSGETQDEDDEDVLRQVKNSHLYQVLAYATHRDIQADRGALVYPSVENEEDQEGKVPGYHGLGHRSVEGPGDVPIHVLTVRIDREGIAEELEGNGFIQRLTRIPELEQQL